jgi:phosphohistidine phosphatase
MKTLLLLRHAKSSWSEGVASDHDRPLNGRGERAAPLMGRLIRHHDLVPDIVVSSSARRAHRTADLVADACGFENDILTTADLYHASTAEWLSVVSELPDETDRALLVGHNPGIEEMILLLGGEHHRMSTAALAQLVLPIENWFDITLIPRADLVELWRPRDVEAEGMA